MEQVQGRLRRLFRGGDISSGPQGASQGRDLRQGNQREETVCAKAGETGKNLEGGRCGQGVPLFMGPSDVRAHIFPSVPLGGSKGEVRWGPLERALEQGAYESASGGATALTLVLKGPKG